jgi:Ca-activated chloride channel family protein
MKTIIISLLTICGLSAFGQALERTISGTVSYPVDGSALPGVNVLLKGTTHGTVTDASGNYSIRVPPSGGMLVFSFVGLQTKEVRIGKANVIDVELTPDSTSLEEVVVSGYHRGRRHARQEKEAHFQKPPAISKRAMGVMFAEDVNTEEYEGLEENIFHSADKKPLSTFSIDVDAASYANLRRFINNGQRPPKEAVRIEEMVNYFSYDYQSPANRHPFSVIAEISAAPWNDKHQLVHIGLHGRKVSVEKLPASNLVFLIDVSGSMNQPNKLPLVKKSFQLLVDQLRAQDHVAIVVYAGRRA